MKHKKVNRNKVEKRWTPKFTNDFMIIPNKDHYELFIKGDFESSYDSQDEALSALKEKGYNYY